MNKTKIVLITEILEKYFIIKRYYTKEEINPELVYKEAESSFHQGLYYESLEIKEKFDQIFEDLRK